MRWGPVIDGNGKRFTLSGSSGIRAATHAAMHGRMPQGSMFPDRWGPRIPSSALGWGQVEAEWSWASPSSSHGAVFGQVHAVGVCACL